MGCFFTVFTPTYNRSDKLIKLYNSLCEQSFRDFEWLVVDDGSQDDTQELIGKFLQQSKIRIRYFYKKNEGKHIAINYASERAKGDWFFIVDSDDYLTEDALQILHEKLMTISDLTQFAGVVGLKGKGDGTAWTTWEHEKNKIVKEYVEGFIDTDAITYRYGLKYRGDRAEVLRTSIIKEHPFPQFENEKFMSENYLWLSLAIEGYIFRWFNEIVYIAEYLDGGLTKNIKQIYKNNPYGRCCVDNLLVNCKSVPIKQRLRASINYYRYGIGEISLKKLFQESNSKTLSVISIPIALLKKWK